MPGLVCGGSVQQEMVGILRVLPQPVPGAALPLNAFFCSVWGADGCSWDLGLSPGKKLPSPSPLSGHACPVHAGFSSL